VNSKHESNRTFEQLLRDGARQTWRPAPDGLASSVMAEIHARQALGETAAAGRLSSSWRGAAVATGVTIVLTVVAAMVLSRPHAEPRSQPHLATGSGGEAEHMDGSASPGPMAILNTLHRAPADLGESIQVVFTREMGEFWAEMREQPRWLIAHLPMQGRLDHEAEERLP